MMSLVRLLGFTTLGCGCVTGRYREVATNREITYVEEKGAACSQHARSGQPSEAAPDDSNLFHELFSRFLILPSSAPLKSRIARHRVEPRP